MGLQQFEERLERLVEGTLAKPFRSNLQPVEIGRRLTREMDLHRRVGVRGLIAPNAFSVTLAPEDVSRFSNFIDALSRELSDAAREHARVETYTFVGPVEVEIFESASLKTGRFHVTAEVRESEDGGFLAELVLPDGRRVTIGGTPVVIGRLPECDVVLNDSNVSRRHAELRRSGDGVFLTDLGSTNGTRVNGSPVREQILASGDEVSVGSTRLIFEMT
jgi:catechol 2,3-dioxygenase-like lactoylglutathione lyase family enzyme